MNGLNKVEVVISGEVFTLVANEDAEYILKLARYIDKKTGELKGSKSSANINPATRSLLIAINIADDLFKETERGERLDAANKAFSREIDEEKKLNGDLSSEIIKLTMENRDLRDRIARLESRLNDTKRELGDYIDALEAAPTNLKTIPMPTTDAKRQFGKGR